MPGFAMGMSVGALAEKTITGGSGSGDQTDVDYNVPETWTITIPYDVVLDVSGANTKNEKVEVSNAHIKAGNELKITATSTNEGYLINADATTDAQIQYTLNGKPLTTPQVILTLADSETKTTEENSKLTFSATVENATAAGDYTDTITFSAQSEKKVID